MADIEIGQTFLNLTATNYQGTKGKYFIAMSCADCWGGKFACFVMHTEHRKEKYRLWCNKKAQKFMIAPNTLSFITSYTSIMLSIPNLYEYDEMYESNIKLFEVAPETICKQIKNCIDWSNISLKIANLIKSSFKTYS